MTQIVPNPVIDQRDSLITNYVGFASFAVLLWDHVDTFADEVELIWKSKRKGFFIWLFLFNRYFTPLSFIVNLLAYLSPVWTYETCVRFVRYEGCTVAIAVEVVGLMMLLRINALYPHQRWITKCLGMILVFETVLNIWLLTRAEPVIHNPTLDVSACSMVFDPSISVAASASAWVPLLYDTIIFGLTVYRTAPPIRREEASYILKRLLEDGLLYYCVIFVVTLVLTVMIIAAPPGTKNVAAQTEQLITVAMMSRITLNLKCAGAQLNSDVTTTPKTFLFDRGRRGRSRAIGVWDRSLLVSLPAAPLPTVTNPWRRRPVEITFASNHLTPTPSTEDTELSLQPSPEPVDSDTSGASVSEVASQSKAALPPV